MASTFDLSKFKLNDARKDLVFLARASENAERYEDMTKVMTHLVGVVGTGSDLTVEERNLLSVAFKNVIGSRRAAWRTLNAGFEEQETHVELTNAYKKQVEGELEALCKDVIGLLQGTLIPATSGKLNESQVFYLKMAGDYYRYLAEFITDKDYGQEAAKNYQAAMDVASEKLSPTHPIRLGLALNYSVCCYEILKDEKKACEMAKRSFDDAISKLDQLDEASYKDSTLIMQLLRDNLTLWTAEANPEDK